VKVLTSAGQAVAEAMIIFCGVQNHWLDIDMRARMYLYMFKSKNMLLLVSGEIVIAMLIAICSCFYLITSVLGSTEITYNGPYSELTQFPPKVFRKTETAATLTVASVNRKV
jgi:hypothetical protein